MSLRDATAADLPRILELTNQAILSGTAIWSTDPITPAARASWMDERLAAGRPVLVADDGVGGVAGFGSYGSFRPHDGFRHTVEHSLYVDPGAQRRGHGRNLLAALIERARLAGLHAMVGGISADNAASIALHERFGFTVVGRLPQVGRKFERWLDLVFMQRLLD